MAGVLAAKPLDLTPLVDWRLLLVLVLGVVMMAGVGALVGLSPGLADLVSRGKDELSSAATHAACGSFLLAFSGKSLGQAALGVAALAFAVVTFVPPPPSSGSRKQGVDQQP